MPLGEGDGTSSLTVTLNRSLSSSEQSAFSATMIVLDENSGDEVEYQLSGGRVTSGMSSRGSYTFNSKYLVISLLSDTLIQDIEIDA